MTAISAPVQERGILMSGPMVRAILDGRKTQTRRVIVPQPTSPAVLDDVSARIKETLGSELSDRRPYCVWMTDKPREDGNGLVERGVRCPFGAVGDRLWVRETLIEDVGTWYYAADGSTPVELDEDSPYVSAMVSWAYHNQRDYCPSIHMPRWASRLTLEITGVRVERVQQIANHPEWSRTGSTPDIRAEGFERVSYRGEPIAHVDDPLDFSDAWDARNVKRGYSWESNPWVWVVEFRRVDA